MRNRSPESLRRLVAKWAGLDVGYAFGLTSPRQCSDCRAVFCAVMREWGYSVTDTARWVGRSRHAVWDYVTRARTNPQARALYEAVVGGRPPSSQRGMTPAQWRGREGTTLVSGGRMDLFVMECKRAGLPAGHLQKRQPPLQVTDAERWPSGRVARTDHSPP